MTKEQFQKSILSAQTDIKKMENRLKAKTVELDAEIEEKVNALRIELKLEYADKYEEFQNKAQAFVQTKKEEISMATEVYVAATVVDAQDNTISKGDIVRITNGKDIDTYTIDNISCDTKGFISLTMHRKIVNPKTNEIETRHTSPFPYFYEQRKNYQKL